MDNSETKSRLEDKITDYSHKSLRERAKHVCRIHNIDNNVLIDQIKDGCYPSIFKAVKELPQNERRLLVSDFYSCFPNGKDLGEYMNRILEIDWFEPKRNYNKKEITFLVREIESAFKLEEHPILIVNDLNADWNAARDAAKYATWDADWNATRNAARDAAKYATWDADRGAAGNAALDAAMDAARGAIYIIAQDIPSLRKKYPVNPFEKLIKVYEKGLWAAGISLKGEFVVLHPKVNKK